ncbi:hypothetical protein CSA56_11815 [candidate division KSB3 bacterium]|uniref:PASTA domain-containing protein n=1 Tax=candidate division KSB3 bacterium TaxID=2044937 RepID=A0A2G6KCS4_9BACT|nr:MAG: hypothetical protein CSA56_11815 [candidate division KSB3 bacterium]
MKKTALSVIICTFLLSGLVESLEAQEGNVIVPNVEGVAQDIAAYILSTAGLQPQVTHRRGRSPLIVQQEPKAGLLVPLGTSVRISTDVLQIASTVVTSENTQQTIQVTDPPAEMPSVQQHVPVIQQVTGTTINTNQTASYFPWYPKRFRSKQRPTVQTTVRVQSSNRQHSRSILRATSTIKQKKGSILLASDGLHKDWLFQFPKCAPGLIPSIKSSVSVVVPPVTRIQQRDATTALNKAGLKLGLIVRVQDALMKSGLVKQQSPASGSVVARGSEVTLWVVE